MATKLPPLPMLDAQLLPYPLQDWLRLVRQALSGGSIGTVSWSNIDFTGSALTDIVTRNHNDLQNKQGGTGSQFNHLTNTEYALVNGTQTANKVLSGPTTGAAAVATFRSLVNADLPATTPTFPGEFAVGGNVASPAGSLAITSNAQSAHTVWAGPVSGSAATPSFKQLRAVAWKDSDTSITNNNTLTDDADLVFAIGANDKWLGRVFLDLTAAIHTTGVKVTITAPTGATGNIHAMVVTDGQSAQESSILDTNTLGAVLDFTAATFAATANNAFLEMIFRVANGANAGNITVQRSQSTSSGTALVIGAGSQLTADRVA